MSDHVCKCTQCHPDDFPSGPRQNENHSAVRFWRENCEPTREDANSTKDMFFDVYLDGALQHQVFEAMGGNDGWVAHYTDHGDRQTRLCTCGHGACAEVARGVVTITKWSPERIAQHWKPRCEIVAEHRQKQADAQ